MWRGTAANAIEGQYGGLRHLHSANASANASAPHHTLATHPSLYRRPLQVNTQSLSCAAPPDTPSAERDGSSVL